MQEGIIYEPKIALELIWNEERRDAYDSSLHEKARHKRHNVWKHAKCEDWSIEIIKLEY